MNPLRWYRLWRMAREVRQMKALLQVLVDADRPLPPLELARRSGIGYAALYGWLAPWEHHAHIVAAEWLEGPFPRRRVYALTDGGRSFARSWRVTRGAS